MVDSPTVPVNVRILDKDYLVACPKGEEAALLASAKRVDKEMRKIRDSGKALGSDRIAVMVALNLAHELLSQKNTNTSSELPETALTHLQKLQERLDAVLEKHKA